MKRWRSLTFTTLLKTALAKYYSDFESMWDGHLRRVSIAKTSSQAGLQWCKTNPVSTILCMFKSTWIQKTRDWRDALQKRYGAGLGRKDRKKRLRAQERRIISLFCHFPKLRRCYEGRRQLNTTHGKIYWFARQSESLLYPWWKQWVLASRRLHQVSKQDDFYRTPRTLSFCANTIRRTECSDYVSVNHGRSDFSG